jgi:hypothetical protein
MNKSNRAYALARTVMPEEYIIPTFFAVILAIVAAIGYGSYTWYSSSREAYAHRLLTSGLQEFEQALTQDNAQSWQGVAETFAEGYKRAGNSNLAPIFLAFESEALLRQGKADQARERMHTVMKQLSQKSPFYYVYAIKAAMLDIDADDEMTQEQGLKQLTSLAQSMKNPQRDYALYQLGFYYFMNEQTDKAKEYFARLVREFATTSPWAHQAQMLLISLA